MDMLSCVVLMVGKAGRPNEMISWIGPIAIFAVMIIFLFRAQKKEKVRRQEMLDAVKTGDKVVTAGGLHGVVNSVKEKTFTIEIAKNVKVEVSKSGVSGVLDKGEGE